MRRGAAVLHAAAATRGDDSAGQLRAHGQRPGRYTYNWLTDAAWAGSCREFVLTRKDGKQHRAFFRFVRARAQLGSGRRGSGPVSLSLAGRGCGGDLAIWLIVSSVMLNPR